MDPETQQMLWAERAYRHPEDPWAWAMAHRRVNGGPMLHLPALAAIARDESPLVVIQKSAQVGITELLVTMALWAADSGYAERAHALYFMPTADQMRDFAQGRFDPAIQGSAYLRSRMQPDPPRRKGADSTRLKQIGQGRVYLRGSESSRQVASIDADLVILDEYDQMAEGTLALAQRRLASSRAGRLIVASTPRYPETGINGLFLDSDQRRYALTCMHCGTDQFLDFEDNVDRERMAIVCVDCRAPLDVLGPGHWVATAPGNQIRGYQLSRLNSPWLNLRAIIEASEDTTLAGQREFQNSDLGEVFSPPGSGLTLANLDAARGDYHVDQYAGQRCVMGVDVGAQLHVVIRELVPPIQVNGRARVNHTAERRLWYAGEVDGFDELDGLMRRYHVQHCVIDALPEVRAAKQFQECHAKSVCLGYYRGGDEHELARPRYHIARTLALQEVFESFRNQQARLPRNARELGGRVKDGFGEYYRELLAIRRTEEKDTSGNSVYRYEDRGKADHYAHAEVYCLMAGRILPSPSPRAYSTR